MITNISLQDFKCFRQLSIDPKLVTVLIGANGAGKSSVLQALMLLKQSMNPNSRSCLSGPLVQIEEHDFPRRESGNTRLTVGISFTGKIDSNSLQVIDKGTEFTFSSEAEFSPDGVLNAHWGSVSLSNSGQTIAVKLAKDQQNERFSVGSGIVSIGRATWPRVFQVVDTSVGIHPRLVELLEAGAATPSRVLQGMKVIPAMRGLVRTDYQLGKDISEDITLVDGLTRIHRRYDVTAAEWAIGAREGDGAGTISSKRGQCLSSAAAGRPCDRLGTLGRARWRGEDAARDPRGAGWRELAGTFGCPLGGSGTGVAVRQEVESLAVGPRRG